MSDPPAESVSPGAVPWGLLWVAIVLDLAASVLLREAEGLRHPHWLAAACVGWIVAIGMLALALRSLPMSVAYPIFLGVTCLGVYLIGQLGYGEPIVPLAWVGLALIVVGAALVNARQR